MPLICVKTDQAFNDVQRLTGTDLVDRMRGRHVRPQLLFRIRSNF